MATSEDPPPPPPPAAAGPKTYSIDVRIFLVLIMTSMTVAFGIGIALGPIPSLPLPIPPVSNVTPQRRLPTVHSAELGDRVVTVRESTIEYDGSSSSSEDDVGGFDNITATAPGDEHLPQGQHLLVDIKGVEAAFLNSEERLAQAMVDAVRAAKLNLLSYHCHALFPAGVSCVGVLLESHISFHTWPDEGVITLDLFTCGTGGLLPHVKTIEKLFGIPREGEEITTLWSHELRGFRRAKDRKAHYLDDFSDLAAWVTSPLDNLVKEQIVAVNSPYQRIDIWDVKGVEDTPSYEDGLRHNLSVGDPRWLTSELVSPERLLFLDGRAQVGRNDEKTYHESLVHPGMFAHPSPKRVGIVGGGEGATLREVLKHRTVSSITMVEIDEMMVGIAREHLPFMSDCSDLVDATADCCFDDDRVNMVMEDARLWWLNNFKDDQGDVQKFDVVIMDALKPEDDRMISNLLFTDADFISSLLNSLTDEGVIAINIGSAPSIHDPRADLGVNVNREKLSLLLEAHPDVSWMFVYEEAHCGLENPHAFMVVCKDEDCRGRWYAESDAVDYWIYERITRAKKAESPLVHYDGATQSLFHLPPKAWETIYCRREPEPFECQYRGLDPKRQIFDFDWDQQGDVKGHFSAKLILNPNYQPHLPDAEERHIPAVFAEVDIPKGSYIMPSDLAASMAMSDGTLENLHATNKVDPNGPVVVIQGLLEFIEEFGHESMAPGAAMNYIEVGGSFMIRFTEDEEEANVGKWMPPHPSGEIPSYSPVYERRMLSFDLFLVATRDIKKGEELKKPYNLWK